MKKVEPDSPSVGRRLGSWKEIAAHLGRSVRTVQRWEREQGLPVHRLPHNKQASVYALCEELDQWWHERKSILEGQERLSEAVAEERLEQAVPLPVLPSNSVDALEETVNTASPDERSWVRRGLVAVPVAIAAILVVVIATWMLLSRPASQETGREDRASLLVARGRLFLKQRTPSGFQEALETFQQATVFDPSNALAYAGLADTYSLMLAFGVMPREQALPRARAAAEQAVAFGPDMAATRTSLSMVLWEFGERDRAIAEAKQAVAADPTYATAQHWYALFLYGSGRHDEAIRQARVALSLDPMSPIIGCDLSNILRAAGRSADARTLLDELSSAHPTFPQVHIELSAMYEQEGRLDLALRHVERAVEFGDDRPVILARLAWLASRNNDFESARAIARRLEAMNTAGRMVPADALAKAFLAAGDTTSAVRIIERDLAAGRSWVLQLSSDRHFEALRADRRWPALHQRLKRLAATDVTPATP